MSVKKRLKLSKSNIALLCSAGAKAPSGGNIQPWRVDAYDDRLIVSISPERSKSFLDVGKLASAFSIGSFVENVEIAANSLGLKVDINIETQKKPDDIIVVIKLVERIEDNHSSRTKLYSMIDKRVTNRNLSDGSLVENTHIDKLKNISAMGDGCKLYTCSTEKQKIIIASILGRADVVRTRNSTLFTQMLDELRWSKDEVVKTKDGIDVSTLEMPKAAEKVLLMMKKFKFVSAMIPDRAFADMTKQLIINSSHVCCLSFKGKPTMQYLFNAGRVLQKLWLEATSLGLSVHPWTVLPFFILRAKYFKENNFSEHEVKEVLDLDRDLRKVFGISSPNQPIFIFRLSYAPNPTARALRLSWDQFTTIH